MEDYRDSRNCGCRFISWWRIWIFRMKNSNIPSCRLHIYSCNHQGLQQPEFQLKRFIYKCYERFVMVLWRTWAGDCFNKFGDFSRRQIYKMLWLWLAPNLFRKFELLVLSEAREEEDDSWSCLWCPNTWIIWSIKMSGKNVRVKLKCCLKSINLLALTQKISKIFLGKV